MKRIMSTLDFINRSRIENGEQPTDLENFCLDIDESELQDLETDELDITALEELWQFSYGKLAIDEDIYGSIRRALSAQQGTL
jgi:hypothetical protein